MKRGKKYFDYKTTNKSFLRLQRSLQRKSIDDNNFMLEIKNPDLIGVDPYDENLPQEIKHLIFKECKENIWYFLREVAKVTYQYGDNPVIDKVTMDISKLAQTYLFNMGISSYVVTPRQTGHDIFTCILNEYEILFKGQSASLAYISRNSSDAKILLQRTYDHISLLPAYIVDSITKTVESIRYDFNDIRAIVKLAGIGERQATDVARGLTQHILYMSDFEYMNNPDILIKESIPIYRSSFVNIMDTNDRVYLITSTSNTDESDSGKKAKEIREKCVSWNDKMFDMTKHEILNLMDCSYPIIYVEKSYKELNMKKEYIEMMKKCLHNDYQSFKREVLLSRE